eukprot:9193549-Pyramimonas_sp.AAC.1
MAVYRAPSQCAARTRRPILWTMQPSPQNSQMRMALNQRRGPHPIAAGRKSRSGKLRRGRGTAARGP